MLFVLLLALAAPPESFSDDYGLERRAAAPPTPPAVQAPAPVAAPVFQIQSSPCANGQCNVSQRRGLFGRRR